MRADIFAEHLKGKEITPEHRLDVRQVTFADEITSSNRLLGGETLDRDYADYDQHKEYLCPLGIRTIRLQGGGA